MKITGTEHYTGYGNYTDIPFADPPVIPMTNVVIARPVKSNPEEFSFAGVNLTFLLVIIVLSILCLNVLIIGITVIICRWTFVVRNYCLSKYFVSKTEKERQRRDCLYGQTTLQLWGLPVEEHQGPGQGLWAGQWRGGDTGQGEGPGQDADTF